MRSDQVQALARLNNELGARDSTMTIEQYEARAREITSDEVKLPAPNKSVSFGALEKIMTQVVEAIAKKSAADFKTLTKRLDALEARPRALAYRGVHKEGIEYQAGEFTTHRGSIWHANKTTTEKPGDSDAWTLACKRGSDGRDAR